MLHHDLETVPGVALLLLGAAGWWAALRVALVRDRNRTAPGAGAQGQRVPVRAPQGQRVPVRAPQGK